VLTLDAELTRVAGSKTGDVAEASERSGSSKIKLRKESTGSRPGGIPIAVDPQRSSSHDTGIMKVFPG
jgi:hypothetical protein